MMNSYIFHHADIGIVSLHHVGILGENLERSLEFYHNLLGMLKAFHSDWFLKEKKKGILIF